MKTATYLGTVLVFLAAACGGPPPAEVPPAETCTVTTEGTPAVKGEWVKDGHGGLVWQKGTPAKPGATTCLHLDPTSLGYGADCNPKAYIDEAVKTVEACPEASLVGCCEGAGGWACYYAPTTEAAAKTDCQSVAGVWETRVPTK